jgi:hypothetical protein
VICFLGTRCSTSASLMRLSGNIARIHTSSCVTVTRRHCLAMLHRDIQLLSEFPVAIPSSKRTTTDSRGGNVIPCLRWFLHLQAQFPITQNSPSKTNLGNALVIIGVFVPYTFCAIWRFAGPSFGGRCVNAYSPIVVYSLSYSFCPIHYNSSLC